MPSYYAHPDTLAMLAALERERFLQEAEVSRLCRLARARPDHLAAREPRRRFSVAWRGAFDRLSRALRFLRRPSVQRAAPAPRPLGVAATPPHAA